MRIIVYRINFRFIRKLRWEAGWSVSMGELQVGWAGDRKLTGGRVLGQCVGEGGGGWGGKGGGGVMRGCVGVCV